jgi:hypothetical protein
MQCKLASHIASGKYFFNLKAWLYYPLCIHKLVTRWTKCVENELMSEHVAAVQT